MGIPPVDEQVVALTLVTPGEGTLHLSKDSNPELFKMARVGLGALGVVTDVTLQCVPVQRLLEHTFVASAKVWALHVNNCHAWACAGSVLVLACQHVQHMHMRDKLKVRALFHRARR